MPPHVKINPTRPRVQYVADGSRASFVFPFVIFAESDLEVFVGDNQYTDNILISGIADSHGGSVAFASPPEAGSLVTLRRQLVLQRTSDFQESGSFRARVLNDELDYLAAALQQLEAEIGRSVRLKSTEPDATLVLPATDLRSGRVLAFDEQGNVVARTFEAGAAGQSWQSLDDIPEGQLVKRLTASEKQLLATLPIDNALVPHAVSPEEKADGQLEDLRSFSPKDIVDMIRNSSGDLIDGGGADSF